MRTESGREPRAWQRRIVTGAGMVWLGLFPLACDFTYTHITLAKWIAMWIGAGLGLPLLAVFALRGGDGRRLTADARSLRALGLWIGAMALAAVFGAFAGRRDANGALLVLSGSETRHEALPAMLGYALIALCMSARPVKLRWVSLAAAAGLLCFCAVTALQYAGINALGLYPEGRSILTNYEYQGTIGNIDMVTGYLSLTVPLTLLPWLLEEERRGAWLRRLCVCAGLAGVLLTLCIGVQAGYLALGVTALGAVYFGLTRPRVRWKAAALLAALALTALLRRCLCLPWLGEAERLSFRLPGDAVSGCLVIAAALLTAAAVITRFLAAGPGLPRWAAAGLLALLLLLALAAVILLPVPERMGGLWEIHEALNGRAQDSFGSERVGIWRAALAVTREHQLLGAGPGTFLRAGREALAREGIALRQSFDTAHSLWLDTAASSGVLGLVCLGWLVLSLMRNCLRGGDAGRVLALCVAAYLAQGCFTFSICLVSPMAWAVFGMAAGIAPDAPQRRDPL